MAARRGSVIADVIPRRRRVSKGKVRGIHEGIYQASARPYWMSPRPVGRIGLRHSRTS